MYTIAITSVNNAGDKHMPHFTSAKDAAQDVRPESYIVVNKETNKAVFEFFDSKLSCHINTDKYKIMTASVYLPTLTN